MKEWKLLGAIESTGEEGISGLCVEVDFTEYTEIFVIATMVEASTARRIVLGQNKNWYDGTTCANASSTPGIFTLFIKADIIDGELYPFGGYNSGYGELHRTEYKACAAAFSPRSKLLTDGVRYVRYDTGNNGAIPAGETMKVYAR